jgi:transcriptional regulator GlxA family with amidase domain
MSFCQFALRARVGFAAYRLVTSDLPLEKIAALEGFADASHLHRTFVSLCGCTPAKYRGTGRTPQDLAALQAVGSLVAAEDRVGGVVAAP